jgi:hypothetical protein
VNFRPARADWAHAGVATLILLALYAATAPRTVALEDDSLFVLSSYYLGIEHPPACSASCRSGRSPTACTWRARCSAP